MIQPALHFPARTSALISSNFAAFSSALSVLLGVVVTFGVVTFGNSVGVVVLGVVVFGVVNAGVELSGVVSDGGEGGGVVYFSSWALNFASHDFKTIIKSLSDAFFQVVFPFSSWYL